jgi:hypothetical protein
MKGFHSEVWSLLAKCIACEASQEEWLFLDHLLRENEEMKSIYEQLLMYYRANKKFDRRNSAIAFRRLDTRIKTTKIH